MDLKWVEDFLSLSRTGNFRESAEERHVSQPAFSRRIQSLETWAGAELFDRSETPVKLTPAGLAFRPTAEEMLALARQGRNELRPSADETQESLTINVLHSLALSFVPDWLFSLEEAIGPLTGKVKITQLGLRSFWRMLENGASDLTISYDDGGDAASLDPRRFRSLVIGTETLIPVEAPALKYSRWEEFLDESGPPVPFLGYPAASRLGRLIDSWLNQHGANPNFRTMYEAPMPEELRPLVLRGRGVAWLPLSIVQDDLDTGRLEASPDLRHVIPAEIRIFRCARRLESHIERIWEQLIRLSEVSTEARGSTNAGLQARKGAAVEPKRAVYRLDGRVDVTRNEPTEPQPRRIRRR